VIKNGTLDNNGQVNVSGTDAFDNQTVDNSGGAIERSEEDTSALELRETIVCTPLPDTITVDDNATLTLNTAIIDNGTLTVVTDADAHDTPSLHDALPIYVIKNGTLDNNGQVNVSGTDAFDNQTVDNSGGAIE